MGDRGDTHLRIFDRFPRLAHNPSAVTGSVTRAVMVAKKKR
jgi:hypothetical protein